MPSPHHQHFLLDPSVTYLNHGSFGACPRVVIERQQDWQRELEREPVQFLWNALEPRLQSVRQRLAGLLGADADDLALVANATTGVNTVVKSLALRPGDELVTTSQGYNACTNALRAVAARHQAVVRVASVEYPLTRDEQVLDAVKKSLTPRTVLVLVDHVTSPTAVVFPVKAVVESCRQQGVLCLIDGAHAPGMLPVALDELGADFYTGNLHKWLCAPKGAAFLHVKKEHQSWVEPLVVSHGANTQRPNQSRFRALFDWTGTSDPSPHLAVPEALDFFDRVHPQGLTGVILSNAALALEAREHLSTIVPQLQLVPPSLLGSMASLVLPPLNKKAGGPDPSQASIRCNAGCGTPGRLKFRCLSMTVSGCCESQRSATTVWMTSIAWEKRFARPKQKACCDSPRQHRHW